MFERAIERYRRVNPKLPPENSLFVRICVLGAVLTGTAAVLSQGYFSVTTIILAPAGIVIGNIVSWFRRDRRNLGLKMVLSLALLSVTGWFFYALAVEPYDTRVPLAELFLWIQVLHSFDVPACRDLRFSLVSSVVLIAMAATLATSVAFLIFLAVFAAFVLLALFGMYLSELGLSVKQLYKHVPAARATGGFAGTVLILAALSAIIFAVTPRLPGMQVQSLPFSAERAVAAAFRGGLMGTSPVDLNRRLPMSRATFSGATYPGFNDHLDLRVRGRLSDQVMMLVKATNPIYHRGIVFERYTGKGWTISSGVPGIVASRKRPPIALSIKDREAYAGGRETIASYYIEADQANVVFAPYQPLQLYFPASAVWQDRDSAITSSFTLDEGIVYSVVSTENPAAPEILKRLPPIRGRRELERYLALPNLPERVVSFAHQAAGGSDNPYAQLISIERALRKRCVYDTGAPFQRENQDSVDAFLFSSRSGNCDQFASAFVVLARLNGIPTRLVTGYTTGDYNPFTGYYEVKARHAHAWTEAYFQGFGWVAFDPTPGSQIPDTTIYRQGRQLFIGGEIADYIRRNFGGAIRTIKAALEQARETATGPFGVAAAIALAVLVAGRLAAALRSPRTAISPRVRVEPGAAVQAYLEMLALLANLGRPRRPYETPSEYATALLDDFDCPEIAVLTNLFEEAYYGGRATDEARTETAEAALKTLSGKLKRRSEKC